MKRVSNELDLKLALGYSKPSGKEKMKNESGAGVNARGGSSYNIFSAPDPLSELVWSPQKGVSLKCTENSLANNKPFLVWNVAPCNDLSAPSEIVRFNSVYDEKEFDRGKTCVMEKTKPADRVGNDDTHQNKEPQVKSEEKDLSFTQSVQMMTGKDDGCENYAGDEEHQTAKSVGQGEVAASSCSIHEENAGLVSTTALEDFLPSRNSGPVNASVPNLTLQKTEFTAENDIQNSAMKEASLQFRDSLPLAVSSTQKISSSSRKRKGKRKDFLHSDEEEDSSHESVESCNSTKVSLRRGKRMREQTKIASSDPTPKDAGNSSFMTWVSNMVNGSSNPDQEEVPSLALALTCANIDNVNNYGISTCEKNIEFQAMFHSLYSPQDKRTPKDDLSAGESKDAFSDDKMVIEVSPITCHREENDVLDEKINTTDMDEGASSPKSPILSQECKSNSPENKKKMEGCSSGSMCMLRTDNNGESTSPSHHSEKKETKDTYDVTSLQSFWITRFSARDPSTVLNSPESRENRDESAKCAKSEPNAQITCEYLVSNNNKVSEPKGLFSEDPDYELLKDMQCNTMDEDAFIAFKDDSKSIHKLNPITPFTKLKSSEAMTSLFARRLDAFKHIIPPDTRNEATCTKTICLFCGKNGHDLHNCSDADESEQEDLLRNKVCSYDWAEGSHSFCIRCFKLDHWAVACPMATSGGRQYWGKHGNYCSNGSNFVAKEEGCSNIIVNHVGGFKEKPTFFNDTNILGHNLKSSVPKGAFDAIRRLRLSRGDILKWLNSKASLFHLDGFFLRLRLGRWEGGGLGGTGYFIARIAESQQDHSTKNSKCISVSLCGITCSVESQYVSNHDFLEEELMTWWCKTSESGGKIPSEDELKIKVEERLKLGF
ncbi:unnamed protein product [Cuscuta campestris]|uniref:Plus3 domain-containing protein n=1 Tax=Cuscuta campestris TaxID=132261 RepID=A0A484M974_9ASTE|nr:unnamed protein product [Cuscuta campestris]